MTVTVERVGHACLQDLGRPGWCAVGLGGNGASDGYSAKVANTLVGNSVTAPVVEVTASAFSFSADRHVLIAVTGAAEQVLVDGQPQPAWEVLVVEPGRRVRVDAPRRGLRSYLAFNGRLDATAVLGSVAPDPLLGVGEQLRAGDRLHLHTSFETFDHPHLRIPVFRLGASRPCLSRTIVVDVTQGPDSTEFAEHALERASPYQVSMHSDYVGLRLLGETPSRSVDTEILSRGVPVGAVEVPPAGGLLVLLRGRLVTAGYPVVGVATAASVDRLGQARPGDSVVFRGCSTVEAVTAARRRQAELVELSLRVHTVLGAAGLAHVLDAAHQDPTGEER